MSSARNATILLAGQPGSRVAELAGRLSEAGLAVELAMSVEEAWRAFQARPIDLLVADHGLPGGGGLALLKRVRSPESRDRQVPSVLASQACTLSMAVAAGRAGASECFELDEEGIEGILDHALAAATRPRPAMPLVLLGTSTGIALARERTALAVGLDEPVLISGERGSGHWSVASYLHRAGRLHDRTLYRIDYAAPETTMRSGEPGTWYLEQVHELPLPLQRELHRRIDAGDVGRILASTTTDLRLLAARGEFHAGLARELTQLEIVLPPLRERRDDLPKLIQATLEAACERLGRPGLGIAPAAMERLCSYSWWDNIDELTAALESLVAFSPGGEITESEATLVIVESDPVARATREKQRSEREELIRLVDDCGGNLTRIAERLGVDRGTVRYRLRKHGLLAREAGQSPRQER